MFLCHTAGKNFWISERWQLTSITSITTRLSRIRFSVRTPQDNLTDSRYWSKCKGFPPPLPRRSSEKDRKDHAQRGKCPYRLIQHKLNTQWIQKNKRGQNWNSTVWRTNSNTETITHTTIMKPRLPKYDSQSETTIDTTSDWEPY
jgi:hypothetical protein